MTNDLLFQRQVLNRFCYNTSDWMQYPKFSDPHVKLDDTQVRTPKSPELKMHNENTKDVSAIVMVKDSASDAHNDSGIGSDNSSLELAQSSAQVPNGKPSK